MESYTVTAPTRVDLAGGTLDLWPLYCLTGGARTINVAFGMNAMAHFEVAPAAAFRVEIQSHGSEAFGFERPLSLEEAKRLAPALQFPVAVVSRYVAQRSQRPEKLIRIRLETEAPRQSGLGGSSTLCVALARGISRVFDDFVEQGWQWRLLDWVKDLEASFLQTPTGTQDYLAALFGGLNCFRFEIGRTERIAYPQSVFQALSERLIVIFSGEMHHSGLSNWELFKSALEGDTEVLRGLHAIRGVAEQLDEEFRSSQVSWKSVGECLNEEWRVRRTMFHVQTKRLEEILQFLGERKVIGAKVCGAAQGGSLIALVVPEHKSAISRACESKGMKVLHAQCAPEGVTIQSGKDLPRKAI